MIDYIKGQIIELTPTELILENAGIGYSILISLQTYEAFQMKTQAVAYIHHYIREDEELYYGFATKDERELFRLLISVSGIGVASARMMLSTLTSEEIRQAILSENINRIKSVKGNWPQECTASGAGIEGQGGQGRRERHRRPAEERQLGPGG